MSNTEKSKEQLQQDLDAARRRIRELERQLDDGSSKALEGINRALRERVKDMNCLYGVSRLIQDATKSPCEVAGAIAKLIPGAFQDPASTWVRLSLDCCNHTVGLPAMASPRLTLPINIGQEEVGLLEIGVGDAFTVSDPFLPQEREVARSIAEQLGVFLERSRATRAVIRERNRAQHYLDVAGVLLVSLDRNGVATMINKRGLAILEVESQDDVVGKDWFETFIPPEERNRVREVFQLLMDGKIEIAEYFENWIMTARGKRILTAWRNSLTFDESGAVSGVLSSGEDITERVRAERYLREREALYSRLYENSHWVMLLIDPQSGSIVDANAAAQAFYGYSKAQLKRMNIADINLMSPDEITMAMRRATTQHQRHFHFVHRLADGSTRDVEVFSGPIEIGGRRLLSSIVHDITDRISMERQLTRLATAIDQADEAVQVLSSDFTYEYINPMGEMILGKTSEEAIGRHALEFIGDSPHPAEFFEEIIQTLRQGRPWRGEVENKVDGQLHTLSLNISPIFDAQGAIINYVCLANDVTSERLMERKLQQVQKMEAIGTLAGGIAHNFNNILAAIMGFAEIAALKVSDDESLSEDLHYIVRGCRRGSELVKQILSFARLRDYEKKPIEPAPLIKESIHLLRATLPKTIRIDERYEADKAIICADPTEIQQMIMNLCTNAAHAMRTTGSTLTVDLERVEATSAALARHKDYPPADSLRLTIADDGQGMDTATLRQVFEPFFTTKAPGEGAGMGMTLVKGVVEKYNGSILVDSTPGEGTRIEILLPIAGGGAEESAPETLLVGGRERILLIDDEADVIKSLGRSLEFLGYVVLPHLDANRALNFFRKDPAAVDLIIADRWLVGMDGLELARAALAERPGLPIVLTTGYGDAEDVQEALSVGIRACMKKPATLSQLSQIVREALEHSSGEENPLRVAL